jgi:hypothetical protein
MQGKNLLESLPKNIPIAPSNIHLKAILAELNKERNDAVSSKYPKIAV